MVEVARKARRDDALFGMVGMIGTEVTVVVLADAPTVERSGC